MCKSIEIRHINNCDTCIKAISELTLLARQNNIPISIKKPFVDDDFFPVVCFVETEDDTKKKTCFEGYNNDIRNLARLFIYKS